MKNARRNMTLAAVSALALAVAPSALADARIHLSLPLPPSPHQVLRHLPVPPPLPGIRVEVDRHDGGRWNYENRHRDDRYRAYENHAYRDVRYRNDGRWVWVEGRWVERPFPGAVWVSGYTDRYGYWVSGYWARYR